MGAWAPWPCTLLCCAVHARVRASVCVAWREGLGVCAGATAFSTRPPSHPRVQLPQPLSPPNDHLASHPLTRPVAPDASYPTPTRLPQLHALELHRADAALGHHAESVEGLLAALFGAEPGESAAAQGGPRQHGCVWTVLGACMCVAVCVAHPPAPASTQLWGGACCLGCPCLPNHRRYHHHTNTTPTPLTPTLLTPPPPHPTPHPPTTTSCAGGLGQGRSRMLDLLGLVTSATPQEPQLGRDAPPDVRRLLQVRARVGVCQRAARRVGCAQREFSQYNATPFTFLLLPPSLPPFPPSPPPSLPFLPPPLPPLPSGLGARLPAGLGRRLAVQRRARRQPPRRGPV